MAFKMKNPSIMKMAKMAGSPMKKTYKQAYEGLSKEQKKKYKGYDDFLNQAKEYNRRKYGTTEPTKAAKEAGITKKELANRKKPTRKVETKTASATISAPSKIEKVEVKKPSQHDKMTAAKKEGGRTARKVKAAERKLRKAAGDDSARGQRKRRKADKKLRKAGVL